MATLSSLARGKSLAIVSGALVAPHHPYVKNGTNVFPERSRVLRKPVPELEALSPNRRTQKDNVVFFCSEFYEPILHFTADFTGPYPFSSCELYLRNTK